MVDRCAARFEPSCVLVFSAGYQASPILVLGLTLVTGGAPYYGTAGRTAGGLLYWATGAAAPLVGVATLLLYLLCNANAIAVLAGADASAGVQLSEGTTAGYVRVKNVTLDEDSDYDTLDSEAQVKTLLETPHEGCTSNASATASSTVVGQGVEEAVRWPVVLWRMWPVRRLRKCSAMFSLAAIFLT
eukprot:SAG31_NODE_740_length_12438_cov_10.788719_12_plen_187_part_00